MAIVVPVGSLVVGPIGPGYRVGVQNTFIGPIPIDDWVRVTLLDGAGHQYLISDAIAYASAITFVAMGVTEFAGGTMYIDKQIAQGAALSVQADWYHANGTLVGTVTVGGWSWDAIGGVAALVEWYGTHPGTPGFGLYEILLAVRKAF